MKKSSYIFGFLALLLFSCGTEEGGGSDAALGCTDPLANNHDPSATTDNCDCEYTGFTAIGTPPASAVRNVLIEEFTGEWCGWCVDGTLIIENLIEQHPGRIFTTAIHQGDFLQTSLTRPLMTLFSANSFPSGVVDRKIGAIGRDLWAGRTTVGLGETAKADIAIETTLIDDNNLEGVVHIDFKENLGSDNYKLIVYVTESGIPANAQQNYYSRLAGAQGHPYYNQNSVLGANEFTHNFVLRKVVMTQDIGSKAVRDEGVFTRKFALNVSAYENENVEILAIIVGNDLFDVLNVAGVKAGETYNW